MVPDADEIDDLLADDEPYDPYADSTFDVLGTSDDTPPPVSPVVSPDNLYDEPEPEPAGPEDQPSFEEAPTQQNASDWASDIGIEDAQYVETGKFAEDTTDHGWQESVYGGPATMNSEMGQDDVGPKDGSDPLGAGFIDLSDGARPPTEEMPNAVMEDLSQVYSAPMSVPEPPPVPGIVDRYTAPPMSRRGSAPPTGVDARRPAFTPNPAPRQAPVRPIAPTPAPAIRRRVPESDDDGGTPLMSLILAFLLGGAGFVLLLALVWTLMNMINLGTVKSVVQPVPATAQPAVQGLDVVPQAQDEEIDVVPMRDGIGGEEVPVEVVPVPAVVPAAVPAVVAAPAPAPAPAPTPAASPRPRPAPVEPAADLRPVATTGTLSIESNRRVIVSIDGNPSDFTPLELTVPPGTYVIGAELPSRAGSQQTKTVDIEAGERKPLFFRF
ncbi:MAG: hypothetical protein ACJAZO_002938 [Myxococcota bacterium]|jgi:hypothetical protein